MESNFRWPANDVISSYRFYEGNEIVDWSGLAPVCEDDSVIRQRQAGELRRPVLIDGVEVGRAYRTNGGGVRMLCARGVTVALWYFISRGHRAIALLPSCFKYSSKTDSVDELLYLEKIGLVQFMMGDVHLQVVVGARKSDGCIVSRSQMHDIIKRWPQFREVIESRLLMPCFGGGERALMFPIDGPQGRFGVSFQSTIRADVAIASPCAHLQLSAEQQRYLMHHLAEVARRPVQWTKLLEQLTKHAVVTDPSSVATDSIGTTADLPPVEQPPVDNPKLRSGSNGFASNCGLRAAPTHSQQSETPPPSSDPDESSNESLPPTLSNSTASRQPFDSLAEIFGQTVARFVTDLLPHETDLEKLVQFTLDAEAHGNLPMKNNDEDRSADERLPDCSPSTEDPVAYVNFFRKTPSVQDIPDLIQF